MAEPGGRGEAGAGAPGPAEREAQAERFRRYLRARLEATGLRMRRLSVALGRDPAYISQLLDPGRAGPRALPSPAELRVAAPLLGVPLLELLEEAWGIRREELELDLQAIAAHQGTWAAELFDLTGAEREQVLNFIGYTKAQRARARAATPAGAEDVPPPAPDGTPVEG